MEKERFSPDEAVDYWKTSVTPESFETYLYMIARLIGWYEDETNSVRQKVAELMYPGENGMTHFLEDYKK